MGLVAAGPEVKMGWSHLLPMSDPRSRLGQKTLGSQ